jgi:hypothetical protein
MKKRLFVALLSLSIVTSTIGQVSEKSPQDVQKEKRMEWFSNAKLGIFIHWGIYSVKGVSESWSFFNKYLPYEEYMSQKDGFTASKYDPKAWVDLIKESGASMLQRNIKKQPKICSVATRRKLFRGIMHALNPFILLSNVNGSIALKSVIISKHTS